MLTPEEKWREFWLDVSDFIGDVASTAVFIVLFALFCVVFGGDPSVG